MPAMREPCRHNAPRSHARPATASTSSTHLPGSRPAASRPATTNGERSAITRRDIASAVASQRAARRTDPWSRWNLTDMRSMRGQTLSYRPGGTVPGLFDDRRQCASAAGHRQIVEGSSRRRRSHDRHDLTAAAEDVSITRRRRRARRRAQKLPGTAHSRGCAVLRHVTD